MFFEKIFDTPLIRLIRKEEKTQISNTDNCRPYIYEKANGEISRTALCQ